MKHRHILYLLGFLLLLSAATCYGAYDVTANSKISQVTVYRDRAQVTRSAKVSLHKGTNQIRFGNLPLFASDDSVRAQGRGGSPTRIVGLVVNRALVGRADTKSERELEAELNLLKRKVEKIEARRKGLAAQRSFIESIRAGWSERLSKEVPSGKPALGELGEALKFVGNGVNGIEDSEYDAMAEKAPLTQRIAALEAELKQRRSETRDKRGSEVVVAVDADRATECLLEISYQVSDARWEPSYDLRLADDGKSAELIYRGAVWQMTGEDWSDVTLSLSSAQPEVGGAPPELAPWQIGFYQPPVRSYRGREFKAVGLETLTSTAVGSTFADVAAAAPAAMAMEARPVTAKVSEEGPSALFTIPVLATVPSDGNRHASVIAVETMPVTTTYSSTPKLSPRAYLTSEVVNRSPYPLLPGDINIFNGATFSGKTALHGVAGGETFNLYFGADDQIKVARDVVKSRKEAGILSGSRVSYNIVLHLENLKKVATGITVLDQLPQALNEEIRVKLEKAEVAPSETRDDGTLAWKLTLAPGEKKTLSYEISVEYPKGRSIVGD